LTGYTFLKSRPAYDETFAAAIGEAGPAGVDSLHLLTAALDNAKVARLLIDLGGDPSIIRAAAHSAHSNGEGGPGLTDDAKAVVEACSNRALIEGKGPDVDDLLLGMASAQCKARQVLNANGIDENRVRARLTGGS
jgi:hypothetical protein